MNVMAQIIVAIGAGILVIGFVFGIIFLLEWLEHQADRLAARPPRRYRQKH